MSNQLVTRRASTRRPGVATRPPERSSVTSRIQKGQRVLEHALESNAKAFKEYRALPGNENAIVASALNGGNPYGNTLGHAMNAFTPFTGENEAPVYRSMSDPNANTPNNIFATIKDNCIFFGKPESLIKECIQEFNNLRAEIQDNTAFKHACISVLIEKGIVPDGVV